MYYTAEAQYEALCTSLTTSSILFCLVFHCLCPLCGPFDLIASWFGSSGYYTLTLHNSSDSTSQTLMGNVAQMPGTPSAGSKAAPSAQYNSPIALYSADNVSNTRQQAQVSTVVRQTSPR